LRDPRRSLHVALRPACTTIYSAQASIATAANRSAAVKNAKVGSPRKKTAAEARPAEQFDVLSWTDEQREIHRAIAEVHQIAARCRLAEIVRELMPEAHELATRGRPRLLATLARILAEPALSASLSPPPSAGENDGPPLQVELIHHVARPIRTIDELNREQEHLDKARVRLLGK
jgi:hypothetical protein